MLNQLKAILPAIVIAGSLMACGSNPVRQNQARQQIDYDNVYNRMYVSLKTDINRVDYAQLWEAYLKTSQPANYLSQATEFGQINAQIDEGSIACESVDWQGLIAKNSWAIKPHLAAADCFRKHKKEQLALFHEDFVAKILQGILSNGDGEHYYSAFEATSWDDIEQIVSLAGYRIVDRYLELFAARQGFYYVLIADDNDGKQHKLYFDSQKFMSSAFGYNGRFLKDDAPLGQKLVAEFGAGNPVSAMALGDMLLAENENKLASEWYLKGTLYENATAYLKLANMCLHKFTAEFSDATCLEFISKAAELGNARAYLYLSALYEQGIWVTKDPKLAQDFFAIASEKLGEGKAYSYLGQLYASDMFGDISQAKELKLYRHAWQFGEATPEYIEYLADEYKKGNPSAYNRLLEMADKGQPNAQFYLGVEYIQEADNRSPILRLNEEQLKSLLEDSAKSGLPAAVFMKGVMYRFGVGYPKNLGMAQKYLAEAASNWHVRAQVLLAKIKPLVVVELLKNNRFSENLLDKKIDKILQNSFYLMKSAAMQGDTEAMTITGNYYREGIGTSKDLTRAQLYYESAAKNDDADGQYQLAKLLLSKKPDQQGIQNALNWLNKSVESNHAGAQFELGMLYRDGNYLQTDKQKAFDLIQKSAIQGYSKAQVTLGEMLEHGYLGPANKKTAIEWYKKAAKKGNKLARQKLARLGVSS